MTQNFETTDIIVKKLIAALPEVTACLVIDINANIICEAMPDANPNEIALSSAITHLSIQKLIKQLTLGDLNYILLQANEGNLVIMKIDDTRIMVVRSTKDIIKGLLMLDTKRTVEKLQKIQYELPERKVSLKNKIQELEDEFGGINLFLSYSTLDSEFFRIKEIASLIEGHQNIKKVYYWEESSGQNIVDYMEQTLKICDVFVLFCTLNSLKSQSVDDEWKSAFQLRKKGKLKIIPVYSEEEFIPTLLNTLLNVKYDSDKFDEFISKLRTEINR